MNGRTSPNDTLHGEYSKNITFSESPQQVFYSAHGCDAGNCATAEAMLEPSAMWMSDPLLDVPMETIYYFDNLFTRARKDLVEQGVYNPKMLKLMKKVRCQSYPDRNECLQ